MRLILLLFLLPLHFQDQTDSLVNHPVPTVVGKTLQGTQINKDFFKGKVTVINFWYIGCRPCMKEMPFLNQLDSEYKNKPFQILGIAPHSREHLAAFNSDKYSIYSNLRMIDHVNSLAYELLPETEISRKSKSDTKTHVTIIHDCDSISDRFNVQLYPTSFIVDKSGVIREIISGYPMETDPSAQQQRYRATIEKLLSE